MSDREKWLEEESELDGVLAEAVRALPREAEPSPLLEVRTLRELRQGGWIGGRRRTRATGWWAAGVAASFALFVSGMVAGQWLGARSTTAALAAQQNATLEEMEVLLERTGGEYVSALSRLAERDVNRGEPNEQAREVAIQILHQAANEVVRLAPNDPITVKILQGFDNAALQASPTDPRTRRRHIVWF